METLGANGNPQEMETELQKAETAYQKSLANKKYTAA
jgi:hypothetical protein